MTSIPYWILFVVFTNSAGGAPTVDKTWFENREECEQALQQIVALGASAGATVAVQGTCLSSQSKL